MIVRINDRGPFIAGRVIDLSRQSAQAIGVTGVSPVAIRRPLSGIFRALSLKKRAFGLAGLLRES